MTDIFNSDPQPKFEDLVGDGKKYSDNDAVAKALIEKDNFIKRLQDEKQKAIEDFNVQALADQIKALEAKLTERPAPPEREVTPPVPTPAVDIEAEVVKAMNARDEQSIRNRNLNEVQMTLTERLGPNYAESVKQRAAELGLDMGYVRQTAEKSPKALYALLQLDVAHSVVDVAPPQTRQNTAAQRVDLGRKNYAYFQKLRKENPGLYHTPAVQLEEYKEAAKQGASFYQ